MGQMLYSMGKFFKIIGIGNDFLDRKQNEDFDKCYYNN